MLTGVILAGGQNRRMGGENKALLPFSNEILIQRQIRIMKQICIEIILVTNDPRSFLPLLGDSIRIITDYIPGKGPLSGMHAAFTLSNNDDIWVVGCDMPFISNYAAELMWKRKQELNCDAVIPFIAGKLYPLHGIYHKRCVNKILKMLDLGEYRVNELLNVIHYDTVKEMSFIEQDPSLRFVMNVNTKEEYEQALRLGDSSHNVS